MPQKGPEITTYRTAEEVISASPVLRALFEPTPTEMTRGGGSVFSEENGNLDLLPFAQKLWNGRLNGAVTDVVREIDLSSLEWNVSQDVAQIQAGGFFYQGADFANTNRRAALLQENYAMRILYAASFQVGAGAMELVHDKLTSPLNELYPGLLTAQAVDTQGGFRQAIRGVYRKAVGLRQHIAAAA